MCTLENQEIESDDEMKSSDLHRDKKLVTLVFLLKVISQDDKRHLFILFLI